MASPCPAERIVKGLFRLLTMPGFGVPEADQPRGLSSKDCFEISNADISKVWYGFKHTHTRAHTQHDLTMRDYFVTQGKL